MNNLIKITILCSLIFTACKPNNLEEQLMTCQHELAEAKQLIADAASEIELIKPEPNLVHTVYLNLKDDISASDKQELLDGIQTLSQINGVFNLQSGTFKDLGDKRALSEYEMVLQMEFQSEQAYQQYQQDSIHLTFKKSVGHLLAGPPATHDFIKR